MKFRENFRILAIIGGIFALLYIFLAVRPLGTELYFTPMWTTDIAHTQVSSSTAAGIPFKLGKNIGYFTEDGNIISNTSFDYKASISTDYYAIFNENAANIPFFNKSGEQVGILEDSGFPYFEDNRIYMFLPGGNSFAQYDSEGKRKWIYEGTSPILAFSSSEAGTIAGFADGTLVTFDHNGNIDQNFIPGGSDYPVILGADISDSGEYLACISGQNRQRFILAKKDKGHSKIIYHEYLAKNQTKQVLVHFDKSGDTVYFNYNSGLGIVGTKSLKHALIPVSGKIISIQESSIDNIVFVMSREKNIYTVYAIEPFASMVGKFSFKADNAFLTAKDDGVYIGRDSRISKMTVSRQ